MMINGTRRRSLNCLTFPHVGLAASGQILPFMFFGLDIFQNLLDPNDLLIKDTCKALRISVRYFRNPCDRDPPTGNFKTLNSSKKTKNLYVYFWGMNVYFWGTNVYFWGTDVYFWE